MAMMTRIGRVSTTDAIGPLYFMGSKAKDSDRYMNFQHHAGSLNVFLCLWFRSPSRPLPSTLQALSSWLHGGSGERE